MKLIYKIALICLLLNLSFSISADETGYEVELIIFEDAKARYIRSEDWSFNDMLNKVTKDKKVSSNTKKDKEFKYLDWSQAKLAPNFKRLQSNSNFKVLVHKRWKQTGLDRENAFNIAIDSSLDEGSDEVDNPDVEIDESELTSYISGNVKLVMSRYLHFVVNLQYFKPMLTEDSVTQFYTFPVVSERRMKSREVHYIDNPLVGIVVLATPYKIATDDANTKPAGYKTL